MGSTLSLFCVSSQSVSRTLGHSWLGIWTHFWAYAVSGFCFVLFTMKPSLIARSFSFEAFLLWTVDRLDLFILRLLISCSVASSNMFVGFSAPYDLLLSSASGTLKLTHLNRMQFLRGCKDLKILVTNRRCPTFAFNFIRDITNKT